jgi:acetyl-CoA carboxylase alpha subunit
MALRTTMVMMAAASINSVGSPECANSLQPMRAETMAAAMRIKTRNWLN